MMRGLLFSLLCQQAIERKYAYLKDHIIADYECYDKTNEDEDRNVLKDLSGNGHDIQLYNFGFAEGSGYGKYPLNFSIMNYDPNEGRVYERTYNKIIVTNVGTKPNSSVAHARIKNDFKLKFKVSGLTEGRSVKLERSVGGSLFFDKDGEYEADIAIETIGFKLQGYQENESCNITIEQIPEYQGALVSDGVDDYGLCENFPILNSTDGYTILMIRKILSENDGSRVLLSNALNISNNSNLGAFCFEHLNTSMNQVLNFGASASVEINKNLSLSYQSGTSYNGKHLNKGDNLGHPYLRLFSWYNTNSPISAAFYRAMILNKDCTTEEIKFIAKQMVARHKEKTGETITLNI